MVKRRVLAEGLKGLVKPYTVPYPRVPLPPPIGFRGRHEFKEEACVGCGACARVCPSDAIEVLDEEDFRVIRVFYGKCTFCARCEEICPEEAITLTQTHELASYTKEEEYVECKVKLAKCPICGGFSNPGKQIEKVMVEAVEFLGLKGEAVKDYEKIISTCPSCLSKPETLALAKKFMLRMGLC